MAGVKLLTPPLYWAGVKPGLQEDRSKNRWTVALRRQMRHGTYDWAKHDQRDK